MNTQVDALLTRLARDPLYADAFFADRVGHLAALDMPAADREALVHLDREAVLYMAVADAVEPNMAPEHAGNRPSNSHLTAVLAMWCCVAYVLFWLWTMA